MKKYCEMCGEKIVEGVLYCSSCGSKIVGCYIEERKNIIDDLKIVESIMLPHQEKFDKRNGLVVSLNTEIKKFPVYAFFIVIGLVFSLMYEEKFWLMGIQKLGFYSLWFLVGIVCPYILFALVRKNEKAEKETLDKINLELEKIYSESDLPIEISFEYVDPRVIKVLISLLEKGRADTLKEAINCMIDDQYKEESIKNQKELKKSADSQSLFTLGILINQIKK